VASKHREQKVIVAVACPTCGAPLGTLCRKPVTVLQAHPGRPLLCRDRIAAWQLVRDGEIPDEQA
jgi:hypothetical protein